MSRCNAFWFLIFGKPVSSASLVQAVSRGLVECLRSACVVTPSLQNLALLALLETSLLQGLTSDAQSPPSKNVLPSPASTAEHTVPCSLSEGLSGKERAIFESSIFVFVESVAAWTQEEKDQQRKLLIQTDIVRKRLAWAAKMNSAHVDVNNNEAESWHDMDASIELDGDEYYSSDDCEESLQEDSDEDEAESWEDMDSLIDPSDDEYYDPNDDEKNVQDAESALKEFESMMAQLSKAVGGAVSKNITFSTRGSCRATASILTLDGKMAGGWTEMIGEYSGTSAFKFNPGFFDVSPEDVRTLKFITNLLGLDDSVKISDLQNPGQSSPNGYYGKESRGCLNENKEEHMEGIDPAWITEQFLYFG